MPEPILEVRGLTHRYGAVLAVDRVSFEIARGEVLTLLGPSGCGKSTTLRLVAGLEEPDAGEIVIGGRVVASTDRGLLVPADKRNVGLVFQSYAIWPHMTVEENVAYPLSVRRRLKPLEIREKVGAILTWVGLGALRTRRATQLSGGQQQRVALARALVYEPDLLLLDEPLSNLDAKLRHEMRVEIRRLQQRLGISILYVTHDQVEAMALSQRIAVMRAGRIEQIGTPTDIYERPATHFVQSFVGATITLEGRYVDDGGARYVELHDKCRLEAVGHDLAPNQPLFVAFRPEHVTLDVAPEREPALNEVVASIKDISYLGDRFEYTLRVGEVEFPLEVPRASMAGDGQTARLKLDPARVKLWPR